MTALESLLSRFRRVGDAQFAGPCPWCGGVDRFCVWPGGPDRPVPRYWCRRCGARGDDAALEVAMTGCGIGEALRRVGRAVRHSDARRAPSVRRVPSTPPERPLAPPPAKWQERGEEVAQAAETALSSPRSAGAVEYLRRRGIASETARAARLGFLVESLQDRPEAWGLPCDHNAVWVPRGIVIPWRLAGSCWRINVRRRGAVPKYLGPAGGSGLGLYGADGLRPGFPAVLVEGEFDALLLAQEAGDRAAVVATGSTSGSRHALWLQRLGQCSAVLVAFDSDDAGDLAAKWWLERLQNAVRWRPVGGKDPTDVHLAGGDLAALLSDRLVPLVQRAAGRS